MTQCHCLLQLGAWGRCKPPVGPGQSPGRGKGGKPPEDLEILHFRYPDEAKNHPVHPCTKYKVRRKTHQIQEPMEKGKFAQHVFSTLGKLKLQINLQISLNYRDLCQKSLSEIFLEHLNSETWSQSSRN